jgi:prepilin-type N-terminal cleavage/methylation domain-containing protein
MLSSIRRSFNKKGFTLIELLVVLGILGILAAALLAAINPVEQLNKAQDTSLKNTSTEFQDGIVQYYSTHNDFPWDTAGANCYPAGGGNLAQIPLSNLTACIGDLVTDGDLKASFKDATNLKNVYVTNPNPQTGNSSDTISCFEPQSATEQSDQLTKYSQTGADGGSSCKSQGGGNKCYWCAQ